MNQNIKKTLAVLTVPIIFFGFYIGSIRTDQIWLIFLSIIVFTSNLNLPLNRNFLIGVGSILTFIAVGLTSAFFLNNEVFSQQYLLVLSQLENYLSLIFILIIWTFLLNNLDALVLKKFVDLFIFCMCTNTALIFLSLYFGIWILEPFYNSIISADRYEIRGISLQALSFSAGRHTGVFTQVFEAGTAYVLALLFFFDRLRDQYPMRQLAVAVVLILGGLMTGSKVFVFGSSLLLICYYIRHPLPSTAVFWLLCAFTIFVYINNFELPWQYRRLLVDFDFSKAIDVFTSGRFSENSSILNGFAEVNKLNWFSGLGFGYIRDSDFSLYEVFAISGALGIFLYIVYFLNLLAMLMECKVSYLFVLNFIVLVIMGSIAGPLLTANKIGFFLIVVTLCHSKALSRK